MEDQKALKVHEALNIQEVPNIHKAPEALNIRDAKITRDMWHSIFMRS